MKNTIRESSILLLAAIATVVALLGLFWPLGYYYLAGILSGGSIGALVLFVVSTCYVKQNKENAEEYTSVFGEKDEPTSEEVISSEGEVTSGKEEATSDKEDAIPCKEEATSDEEDAIPCKEEAASDKEDAIPCKEEATSGKKKATSGKKKATSDQKKEKSIPLELTKREEEFFDGYLKEYQAALISGDKAAADKAEERLKAIAENAKAKAKNRTTEANAKAKAEKLRKALLGE